MAVSKERKGDWGIGDFIGGKVAIKLGDLERPH